MSGFRFLLASLAMTACACFAAAGEFRVEDGKIVVGSPFDLEIGSPEYAKALGKGVESHKSVRKDPKTGAMTTNWYHSAEARFVQPYFGVTNVWLSFRNDGKTLSHVNLSIGVDKKSFGGKLTFDDCCKKFDEAAAEMSKRLGEELEDKYDSTEEEALERLAECAEDHADSVGYATSFRFASADATNRFGDVEYRLMGLIHNDKTYSLEFTMARPFRHEGFSGASRVAGHIPVYTNMPHSVDFLPSTPGQEKAHKEADALRATIKRLFDVDLDAPSVTNDTAAAITSLTNAPATPEWFSLKRPFAGCTERKMDQVVRLLFIPVVNFGIRHAFDGDVGEDELKAEAQRILDELERELGAKIPALEKPEKKVEEAEPADATPPALGDWKAMMPPKSGEYFNGGIGDIAVIVKYAVPSYVKRGGKYEVALRGAVVVEVMQSQFLAGAKKKTAEKQQGKGGH